MKFSMCRELLMRKKRPTSFNYSIFRKMPQHFLMVVWPFMIFVSVLISCDTFAFLVRREGHFLQIFSSNHLNLYMKDFHVKSFLSYKLFSTWIQHFFLHVCCPTPLEQFNPDPKSACNISYWKTLSKFQWQGIVLLTNQLKTFEVLKDVVKGSHG